MKLAKEIHTGNVRMVSDDFKFEGFVDVTSYEEWERSLFNDRFDFEIVKSEVNKHLTKIAGADFSKWEDLDYKEQSIACRLSLAPKEKADTLFSNDEQIQFRAEVLRWSHKSRKVRWIRTIAVIQTVLNVSDMYFVMKELSSYMVSYVHLNIIGTKYDGNPGIMDFIESTGAVSAKMNELVRVPNEGTFGEFIDELKNTVIYGKGTY